MNRKLQQLYILMSFSLISLLITGIFFSAKDSEYEAPQTQNPQYILKEYFGRIGIFTEDESIPYEILEADISYLPKTDTEKLKEGIEVYSEEELYRLIEDFSG